MINRIYSDDYSCFNQKTELKMKYGDDTVKFVSDFYTRLKIEALLLGKIVLTDSRFFDLPAFKLMKDDELLAFFDTARDNNMLEVRYRPNTKRSGLIKQMFLKKYWFESTSNQQLSNFLLNIGDELAALEGNGRIIIDDTIESYFRSIEIYKGAELKVIRSSYENFKDRMILLEEIRTKRCKSLFVPWGERAEDLAQTPKYRDLSDVMSQNKKTMIDLFTNRVNDLDDNSKQVILKELNKPWPLLTEVKIAAAKSEKSKEFYTLFQNWYKLGIACQHFSNIVELQHQPASSDMLELTLGSGSRRKAFQVNLFPKEIREIINE
ncbi:MAG: hypothetical protein LBQ68_06945, partial [Clostridiales bacterium]|nr:hypothetical protein [Clostridiales bacterium]